METGHAILCMRCLSGPLADATINALRGKDVFAISWPNYHEKRVQALRQLLPACARSIIALALRCDTAATAAPVTCAHVNPQNACKEWRSPELARALGWTAADTRLRNPYQRHPTRALRNAAMTAFAKKDLLQLVAMTNKTKCENGRAQ